MICDTHIHFIPEEISKYSSFYKGVWSDKEKLFEYIKRNNIKKALLVYPPTDVKLDSKKLCEVYNRNLEVLAKENSNLIAFGIVDLSSDLEEDIKDLKDRGFRGISIPSSYNKNFISNNLIKLFELVEKYKLFIFVHPQTIEPIGFERVKDPLLVPVLEYSFDNSMFLGMLMMEGILDRFYINFIFSSLGGVVPFLKDRFDRVYDMLFKRGLVKNLGKLPSEFFKKIYVDTSGASQENIRLAIDTFGEDKILWGSDYPVISDIDKNLKSLDDLGNIIKEKIVYKNFLRLFNEGIS